MRLSSDTVLLWVRLAIVALVTSGVWWAAKAHFREAAVMGSVDRVKAIAALAEAASDPLAMEAAMRASADRDVRFLVAESHAGTWVVLASGGRDATASRVSAFGEERGTPATGGAPGAGPGHVRAEWLDSFRLKVRTSYANRSSGASGVVLLETQWDREWQRAAWQGVLVALGSLLVLLAYWRLSEYLALDRVSGIVARMRSQLGPDPVCESIPARADAPNVVSAPGLATLVNVVTGSRWTDSFASCERSVEESVAALSAARERFQLTSVAAGAYFFEYSPTGAVTYASDSIRYVLGYSPQERLAMPSLFLDRPATARLGATEDDLHMMRWAIRRGFEESLPTHALALRMRRKDGRLIDALVSAVPKQDAYGQVVSMQCVVIDVSSQKSAENQLKRMVESSAGIYYACRFDGNFAATYVSENAFAVTGFESERFTEDPNFWFGQIHPDDRDGIAGHVESILRQGSGSHEYRWQVASGAYIWMSDQIRVIRGPGGEPQELVGLWQDISDRKAAESALAASEERARTLVERLECGVAVTQDELTCYANPALAVICGLPLEKIVGAGLERRVHPEDLGGAKDRLRRRLAGEPIPEHSEYRVLRPDGSVRLVSNLCTPIIWNSRPATLSLVTDITRSRELESELRSSEQRHRAIFDRAAEAILIHRDSRILAVNRAGERISGYGLEELVGMSFSKLAHPQDLARLHQQVEKRLNGEPLPPMEFRIIGKDGQTLTVVGSAQPIDWEGQPALLSIVADVSGRRRAERLLSQADNRYRALFDNAGEGILVVRDEVVLVANPAAATLAGRSADQLVGLSLSAIVDPEDQRWVCDRYRRRQCAEALPRFEHRILRMDGVSLWVDVVAVPVEWEGGTAVLAMLSDLTERKAAEERTAELQKSEVIAQMTGELAHDFNNLLGVVIGNLDEIILQEGDRPRSSARLHVALEAALRGAEVTHSLLTVARRQPLNVELLDLARLTKESLPLVQASIGPKVELDFSCLAVAPHAYADASGFKRALLNLALNARDSLRDRSAGGRIELRVEVLSDATKTGGEIHPVVSVSVRDNGRGMSPLVLQRATEPFFTTKGRDTGTGLGLSMVQGYVSQVGGRLLIDSTEGYGTCVSMLLPERLAGQASVLGPDQLAGDASNVEPGRSVLVVEDIVELGAMASEWLERLGFEVLCVHDPASAKVMLEERAFDILFTDVVLPGGMDGVELSRWALQVHPGIRVLLTSGHSVSLVSGASLPGPVLDKPYRFVDLRRSIEKLG